jgi:hypothetical protein
MELTGCGEQSPPTSNGGFSEIVRFGEVFISTINIESLAHYLYNCPPFVLLEVISY